MYRSNRYRSGSSRRYSAPKRKGLTDAQVEANRKRFQEAEYTVEGRYTRDALVTDGRDVYRIVTYGISYHEDVSSRLYGANKARPPKEWKATTFLRGCIESVLAEGTHEPRSRGGRKGKKKKAMPVNSPAEFRWEDGQPNSMASFPYLTLHGDCVLATQPHYDDAPSVAWKQDAKLCQQIREAASIAPKPYLLPNATIKPRKSSKER